MVIAFVQNCSKEHELIGFDNGDCPICVEREEAGLVGCNKDLLPKIESAADVDRFDRLMKVFSSIDEYKLSQLEFEAKFVK